MSESVHSLRSRASGRSGFSGFGAASQSQSHFRSSIAGSSVTLAGATTDRETATEDLLFHASWSLIETSWWWKHVFYPLFHYGIFVQCIFIALDPWSSWISVPREFVRVVHFLVTFSPFPTTALAVRILWIISASIVVLSIGNVLLLLILHRSESGQTSFFRNLGLHLWWTSSSLFFIPLMSLLSYPLRCDYPNGRLLLFPDSRSEVDCFGLEQSLMSIFGILLGMIWTYFSSVISSCAYEFRPSQKHSLGGPLVGRFRSILIVSVFLLVFGRAALSHSAILRSLLSLTFGVVLTCSVVYFNFFYLSYTNIIHVSMGIISVGASLSSLSVSIAQHERVGSYIGIGVFILSLFVGPLLSSWFLSMWFSSLHTKYLRTLLEDDEDVGPNLGQHLFRSPFFVEFLSRPVPWLPLVDQIHRSITNFELAEELFPKSTFVRVFHLLTLHENIMEHRVILHKLKDIRKDFILSVDYKFILFCIALSISEVENENTDVGRRVNLIRKRMRRCRAGLRQFFKNLLSENASTDLFPGAIQAIYKSEETCKNHFRHLLRDHPKNIRTLRLFAEFLRDIERDPKTARHYIVLADRYETEGARVSKEAEGLHLSSIDSTSVRGSERAFINEAARSELTDKESRASSIQLSSVVEKFRLLANLEGIDLENSRVSREASLPGSVYRLKTPESTLFSTDRDAITNEQSKPSSAPQIGKLNLDNIHTSTMVSPGQVRSDAPSQLLNSSLVIPKKTSNHRVDQYEEDNVFSAVDHRAHLHSENHATSRSCFTPLVLGYIVLIVVAFGALVAAFAFLSSSLSQSGEMRERWQQIAKLRSSVSSLGVLTQQIQRIMATAGGSSSEAFLRIRSYLARNASAIESAIIQLLRNREFIGESGIADPWSQLISIASFTFDPLRSRFVENSRLSLRLWDALTLLTQRARDIVALDSVSLSSLSSDPRYAFMVYNSIQDIASALTSLGDRYVRAEIPYQDEMGKANLIVSICFSGVVLVCFLALFLPIYSCHSVSFRNSLRLFLVAPKTGIMETYKFFKNSRLRSSVSGGEEGMIEELERLSDEQISVERRGDFDFRSLFFRTLLVALTSAVGIIVLFLSIQSFQSLQVTFARQFNLSSGRQLDVTRMAVLAYQLDRPSLFSNSTNRARLREFSTDAISNHQLLRYSFFGTPGVFQREEALFSMRCSTSEDGRVEIPLIVANMSVATCASFNSLILEMVKISRVLAEDSSCFGNRPCSPPEIESENRLLRRFFVLYEQLNPYSVSASAIYVENSLAFMESQKSLLSMIFAVFLFAVLIFSIWSAPELYERNEWISLLLRMFLHLPPSCISSVDVIRDFIATGQAVSTSALDSAIHEGEEKLYALLQSTSDGIVLTDEKGTIELVNDALCKMFGYRREDLLGGNIKVLTPPGIRERHDELMSNYISRSSSRRKSKMIGRKIEQTAVKKDGSLFPITVTISEARLKSRLFFSGFIRDITSRTQQTSHVQAQQEKIDAVFGGSKDGLIISDTDGVIQEINQATIDILGYSREELVGYKINKIMPEPHRTQHDEYLTKFLNARSGIMIGSGRDVQALRRDGTLIPVHVHVVDGLDYPTPFLAAFFRDLTNEMQSRNSLLRAKAELDEAIRLDEDAIIVCDDKGTMRQVNDRCLELFRYSRSEICGQNVRVLVDDEIHRMNHDSYIANYMRTGKSKIVGSGSFVVARRRDRTSFHAFVSVQEGRSKNQRFFAAFIRDTSELLEEVANFDHLTKLRRRLLSSYFPSHVVASLIEEPKLTYPSAEEVEAMIKENPMLRTGFKGSRNFAQSIGVSSSHASEDFFLRPLGMNFCQQLPLVTLFQSDVVNFSRLSSQRSPEDIITLMSELFDMMDKVAEQCKIERIKIIGDAYVALCGMRGDENDHALRICNFAVSVIEHLDEFNVNHGSNLQLRIGVHSGSIISGVLDTIHPAWDLYGDTLTRTQQLETYGEPNKVHISQETCEFIESSFTVTRSQNIDGAFFIEDRVLTSSDEMIV